MEKVMMSNKRRNVKCVALATALLLGLPLAALSPQTQSAQPQPPQSDAERTLLTKAKSLEARGRLDMARENWKQVLLSDPNNQEATAGVARADVAAGNNAEARAYLDKLRQMNPNDPEITRIESMGKQQSASPQLARAGKLAESGQYGESMSIYRQQFGNTPPPGDVALAYYDTEAATEAGRPAAIAGLRDYAHKYPNDPRYDVSLGRILTYNPNSRREGIAILERHPNDPASKDALRQALTWDAANPATSAEIRRYLKGNPDQDLQARLNETEARQARNTPRPQDPEEKAAYAALAANHPDEAEKRFQAMLAKKPKNIRALEGLGYVRLKEQRFREANMYFQQAQAAGARDAALRGGLDTSAFWMTMGDAGAALTNNQPEVAQQNYLKALQMRPASTDALAGLGGLYLKQQQPAQAVGIYARMVRVQSNSVDAWLGLFDAQLQAGDPRAALATMRSFPGPVRASLGRNPEYLRNLAVAYQAVGQDADAERVLQAALDLPFPDNGRNMKGDAQLQYAALLAQANRNEQAAGLYRQVLAQDPNNVNAYQGLVQALHAQNRDSDALLVLQQMPPQAMSTSQRDPGFLATIAGVYQTTGHLDLAQSALENAAQLSTANHQPPAAGLQLQLASIYIQRGNTPQAYALYQQVLTADPKRVDAWKGLISSLHSSDRDREALAELQQIPPDVRATLDRDPQFLEVLASIYGATGNPQLAIGTLQQVSAHYQQQGVAEPVDLDVQYAYLLMNSGDDRDLYSLLLRLGGRPDLTDAQRVQVQQIWALWSLRRANAEAAKGNYRRSVQILDAANRAFPNNLDVQKALAGGYQQAGEPKRAEAVYLQMDWSNPTLTDYRGAVSSALAANDRTQALKWLEPGLKQYPNDPQLLAMGAQYEEARGDSPRAAEYYRASLDAMGPGDPADSLTGDLRGAKPLATGTLGPMNGPSGLDPSQDLATVLAPGADTSMVSSSYGNSAMHAEAMMPLPGSDYTPGEAPVQVGMNARPVQRVYAQRTYVRTTTHHHYHHRTATDSSAVRNIPDSPVLTPARPAAPMQQQPQRLGNYQPSSLHHAPKHAMNASGWAVRYASWSAPLSLSSASEWNGGDTEITVAPNAVLSLVAPASNGPGDDTPAPKMHLHMPGAQPATAAAVPAPAAVNPAAAAGVQPNASPAAAAVANIPPAAAPAPDATPAPVAGAPPSAPASVPAASPAGQYTGPATGSVAQVPSVPTQSVSAPSTPTQGMASQAPGSTQMQTGYSNGQLPSPTRLTTQDYAPASTASTPVQAANLPASQTSTMPAQQQTAATVPATPQTGSPVLPGQYPVPQQSAPAAYGAPPPGYSTGTPSNAPSYPQYPAQSSGYPVQQQPGYDQNAPQNTDANPPQYSGQTTVPASSNLPPAQTYAYAGNGNVSQPAGSPYDPGYGTGYTGYYDYRLPVQQQPNYQRVLPPLTGSDHLYQQQLPARPLSDRERIEASLDRIEGGYSPWLGASAYVSYRSGAQGLDHLLIFAAPIEGSAVIGNSVRATIIAKPVVLDSGTLNGSSTFRLGTQPVGCGSTGVTCTVFSQTASGIGGELQLRSNNYGGSVGYTPGGFLVGNVIGSLYLRPAAGPFTFTFVRDSVLDTQLSYAGLRDPGQAGQPIWGGVIYNSGEAQYAHGNAATGFYLQGGGQYITGNHVQDNYRADGDAGAYFRVKEFPGYGSLTIGANVFAMHYNKNLRFFTYGQGGYFSPDAYLLANVPITFNGHYGRNFHYRINGSLGVQAFSEDSSKFFPLDPSLQGNGVVGANQNCGTALVNCYPARTSVTGNYLVDAEGAYRITDHWYFGGFVTANNTRDYNNATVGFFVRYMLRTQYASEEGPPTGIFPVNGLRPILVP